MKRAINYLPEDDNQQYYSSQMSVCRDLLNAARSTARGTEAANRAANSHRETLENNKQWFTRNHFRRLIHEAQETFCRVLYYQSREGHIDLPAARRLQDALIVLLSLSAGGQRPQFVHLLEYDTINHDPRRGWFLQMPDEKIVRVAGSRVPLPTELAHFWGHYVKHIRPVLMSSEQRAAWYGAQNPIITIEERKKLTRKVDRHLFF